MFARHNTKARGGFITATIAALLIALSPNLYAQSPLTVQPSTGNVGIGTTAPAVPFHVMENATGAIAKIEQTASCGGAALSIQQSGSSTPHEYRLTTTTPGHFKIQDTANLIDRIFLTSSGNVGIGIVQLEKQQSQMGEIRTEIETLKGKIRLADMQAGR